MRGVLLGVLLAIVVAAPASALPIEVEDPLGCRNGAPMAFTPAPFTEPIDVRVLVLIDGVTEAVARAAMVEAAKPYEPLALRLRAVEYRRVSFTVTDADQLIEASKDVLSGGRPAGVDLVYTFTGKNMTGGLLGDGVAGKVDCVGGVAHPDNAFGVGEVSYDSEAVIAGHEMGHLLGAHHHYANCAERGSEVEVELCTIMINDIFFASLRFSSINAALVRGHAETYLPGDPFVPPTAEPTPEEPKPEKPAPEPAPAPDPQPAPEAAPAPAPMSAPHQAQQDRRDLACGAATAALARARTAVKTARKRLSRANTRARRRALRRSVAARDRAQRAAGRACNAGG
jgi:hypothetical protein